MTCSHTVEAPRRSTAQFIPSIKWPTVVTKTFFRTACLQSHHNSIFTNILNTANMTHQWKKVSGCTASEITTALCLWDTAHAAYVPIPSDKIRRSQKTRFNSFQNCLILFSCFCCLSLMTRARGVCLQWAFDQNPEGFQSSVASSCISLLIMQTGSATQESGVILCDSYKPF